MSTSPPRRSERAGTGPGPVPAERLGVGAVIRDHETAEDWLVVRVRPHRDEVLLELTQRGVTGFRLLCLAPNSTLDVVGAA